nr:serine/threonine-protein kinase Nek4 [Ciona intestinalis]|eukprot:XP_002128026.1 serine/threonine-protein kinase Nek4 [Ciona intestinalis]
MGGLDDYDILKAIGKGSYGEVHLIQHKKERKQYVVKKLALQKVSRRERKAAESEAKLLSQLKHPNIVSYKDSFENDDGFLYIVMGFAEGGDLYTKLREQREKDEFLLEVQVVRWFIQICMALQYLHQKHILHRDLKTQNIFLTKAKMIKVGDLGIARVLEGASDMATTLIGTPYYMSPELFSNKPYNHKSDVWALGCCVYEMTTLKHAFNAKDMNSLVYKILKKKMPKMPAMYSEPLCELIKIMLHQTAEKRPSVNRILRNPFIKKHIQLFLDESSRSRRPTSGKSRVTSSRKTSTSSTSSRCSSRESGRHDVKYGDKYDVKPAIQVESPQPKYTRDPDAQPVVRKVDIPPPSVEKKQPDVKVLAVNHKVDESKYENRNLVKPTIEEKKQRCKSADNERKQTPPIVPSIHTPGNHGDSGCGNHGNQQGRVRSAGSSDGDRKQHIARPLPHISDIKHKTPTNNNNNSSSKSSNASPVSSTEDKTPRISSARERRRREKKKNLENKKISNIENEGSGKVKLEVKPSPVVLSPNYERQDSQTSLMDSAEKSEHKAEENQFFTLLHTTLRLSDNKDGDSPPMSHELSPVSEGSETSSTVTSLKEKPPPPPTNQPHNATPCATKVKVIVPEVPKVEQPKLPSKGISQATLASTGKLMDRIVALRKDCIQGLGVPLLHRAYELLDNNLDEDETEKHLIQLLGSVRFNQWAGKIWQLKFCEESIFNHCGSITAY